MARIAILTVLCAVGLLVSGASSLAAPDGKEKGPNCSDGEDNDGDGLIDAEDPDCGGDGGGNTGNGQDTPADLYLYHIGPYGILGDQFPGLTVGDTTVYPANSSAPVSCADAIITDQTAGYMRMFVPGGNCTDGINRHVRIRSLYDLDQDGLCADPSDPDFARYSYHGREDAGKFTLYNECVGFEPDGAEDIMLTLHLNSTREASTPVGIQVRLLEYGDVDGNGDGIYQPQVGVDPALSDITFIGSQERAYVITLVDEAIALPTGDPDVRTFENFEGIADICEVTWKNAHAKDCLPIGQIVAMQIKGAVDYAP